MSSQQQQRAREIFKACRRAETPHERAEIIERECGDDDVLQSNVVNLIEAHEANNSFLEKPLDGMLDERDDPPSPRRGKGENGEVAATVAMGVTERPGTQIGPYKLLQQIGEGGFGVVYMAEQTESVRRKVALKIIKPGMDTKEVIARFEAERQALALMDHPNIARVLAAGAYDPAGQQGNAELAEQPSGGCPLEPATVPCLVSTSARPYFVMELVHGIPITEFCDENKLSTRQRLELFVDVCRAVQHAHQKGIIHRDLKPSNVMITIDGDKPMPKVIDFGVSKALSQQLTERTLFTAYGQMVGTPLYMSPEQAQFAANDIDTRSDVYSLGVLLYELLTGSTPFDKETLQNSGFDAMRRIICEVDPLRPSARVSTLAAAALSTASDRRKVDSRQLGRSLRGELDWIVMKALEKDRTRRYESASAFAADIQRYLADEPVEACPPSAMYRLKKYARKYKGLLTTATLLIAMLVISTAVSGVFAYQANEARIASEKSEENAKEAQAEAETEKEKAVAAQKKSDENFSAALTAIDRLLEHSSNDALAGIPEGQEVRFQMMKEALAFYDQFIVSHADDREIQHRAAQARLRMVFLRKELGHTRFYDENELRIALREMLHVVAKNSESREYRHTLAEVLLLLGESLCGQRQFTEGMAMLERSNGICDQLIEQFGEEHDREMKASILHSQYGAKSKRGDRFDRVAFKERTLETMSELPDQGALHYAYTGAHTLIGQHLWNADPETAKQHIEKAIESKRKQAEALGRVYQSQLGLTLVRTASVIAKYDREQALQNTEEAVEILTELISEFPSLDILQRRLSNAISVRLRVLLTDKTEGERIKILETVDQYFPKEAMDSEFHDKVTALIQKLSNPLALLNILVEKYPNEYRYYRYRGVEYREQGEFAKALADASRSIELAGDDDLDVYRSRADTYLAMDEIDKAEADYARYVSLSKDAAGAYAARAEFYLHELRDYEKALADFDKSIAMKPKAWWRYKRRAVAHFRLKNYDDALADLERDYELGSGDVSGVGWIPANEVIACPDEDFKRKLREFADRVVKERNRSTRALAVRIPLLVEFGEIEQAERDIVEILQREDRKLECRTLYYAGLLTRHLDHLNDFKTIYSRMLQDFGSSEKPVETHFTAWTCALAPDALDDYALAIRLARHAVGKDETNQQYLDGLGAILLRAGEYDEAKEQLERALKAGEDDNTSPSYIHYFLAMTEHHLGNEQPAKSELQMANQLADAELAGSPAWNRRLTLQLLRTEATRLIDPPVVAPASANQAEHE